MNLLSYNIRGGGTLSKRKRVSFLVQSFSIDICFIQETKLPCFNETFAKNFWGSSGVEWTASNSLGAAGGMVILWRKDSLSLNFSFIGKGYVGINFLWKGVVHNLVNVYALCSVAERRVLWRSLLERKRKSGNEEWCVVGDFNEIVRREERKGEGFCYNARGMTEFREFIENMELEDIHCVGGKFTWFKDNGKAMSRLDRFLVSRKMIDLWGVLDQRI
ncbi:uncharacterized protein LOC131604562 [Vicia villosa]|uniref:uncharacterized protein LOC131604562 n=1 Tax=Vicia villosa TaxID=3911 RepID=UPI00273CE028|nr:uncharacterized protein LOC131604562 [Vicia villosa]